MLFMNGPAWLAASLAPMVRSSMATLAPACQQRPHGSRLYRAHLSISACETYNERVVNNGALARELRIWEVKSLRKNWHQTCNFGQWEAIREDEEWHDRFRSSAKSNPRCHRRQLYAEPKAGGHIEPPKKTDPRRSIPGSVNGFVYAAGPIARR